MESPDGDFQLGCHSCHATAWNDVKRVAYAAGNRAQEEVVRRKAAAGEIRLVHGPREVACGPEELVVLCLERDGALWIDAFIRHHLALGARHVVILDNGSTDDTVARASGYGQVTVLSTGISFKRYQLGLRRWLTRTYGAGRWSVTCDVDELFDYPGSARLPLPRFLRYLNRHGYKAVTAHMLDMFSDVPFSRLESRPGDDLRARYPFYDLTGVVRTRDVYWLRNGQCPYDHIFCTFGGLRRRFFGAHCLLQTKHPLVFADPSVGVYTYDGHFATRAPVADVTALLLHYKYLSSLASLAEARLARGELYAGSTHYEGFRRVLGTNPGFSLHTPTAQRLDSVDQLVGPDFLAVSDRYLRWVEEHGV
jgi:hypothetical protein